MLADDSHVISYLIFVENWEKMSQNLSSAAVVTGALRDRGLFTLENRDQSSTTDHFAANCYARVCYKKRFVALHDDS